MVIGFGLGVEGVAAFFFSFVAVPHTLLLDQMLVEVVS